MHQMVLTLVTMRRGLNTLLSTPHFFYRYGNFLLFKSRNMHPSQAIFSFESKFKACREFLRHANVYSKENSKGARLPAEY